MEESLLEDKQKLMEEEDLMEEERSLKVLDEENNLDPLTDDSDALEVNLPRRPTKRSNKEGITKLRKIFDCGIWFLFTIIFTGLMIGLFTTAHPKTGLLVFCALVPGVLLMITFNAFHYCTSTSSELQWEMFWSGAISILVALVGEIALNGAITSLLRVIAPKEYKTIVENKHGHYEVITTMSPQIKLLYFFLNAFFIAGFVEEACKLGLVYRIQKKLKTPLACVIYGVCGAIGFATVENIKYVVVAGMKAQYNPLIVNSNLHSYFAQLLKHNPFLYGIVVAFERGLTSIPGHCLFGALIGLGFARRLVASDIRSESIDEGGIKKVSLFSILFPSLFFHGLYDFSLMSAGMLSKGVLRSVLISFAHSLVIITFVVVVVFYFIVQRRFKKCIDNTKGQNRALLEEYDELSL